MKTRERWLVGMMSVAVIYAGIKFLTRSPEESPGSPKVESGAASSAGAYAAGVRQRLDSAQLSPDTRRVLDAVAGDWPESPLLERAAASSEESAQQQAIQYTGYVHIGDVRIAIINGHEYRESEALKASDLIVESNAADQVVLVSNGGVRRMSIARKEFQNKGEQP